jgi:hypothetical protein
VEQEAAADKKRHTQALELVAKLELALRQTDAELKQFV